jgi:hypothetical protein
VVKILTLWRQGLPGEAAIGSNLPWDGQSLEASAPARNRSGLAFHGLCLASGAYSW